MSGLQFCKVIGHEKKIWFDMRNRQVSLLKLGQISPQLSEENLIFNSSSTEYLLEGSPTQ